LFKASSKLVCASSSEISQKKGQADEKVEHGRSMQGLCGIPVPHYDRRLLKRDIVVRMRRGLGVETSKGKTLKQATKRAAIHPENGN
jgi:hypothetical protein